MNARKEKKEFKKLRERVENLLSRINDKLQRAYITRDSILYDPVYQVEPPDRMKAEELITQLQPLQGRLKRVVAVLREEKEINSY